LGKRGSQQLFESDKSKRISKLGSLTTPSHLVNKRQKLEQDSSFKVTKFEDSADSEGEEIGDSNFAENDDPNNSASRKKRGLKILSVKVQELVS